MEQETDDLIFETEDDTEHEICISEPSSTRSSPVDNLISYPSPIYPEDFDPFDYLPPSSVAGSDLYDESQNIDTFVNMPNQVDSSIFMDIFCGNTNDENM